MMAKMVLRELMDPLIFIKFKSFLMKGNDPSCLHEFLLQILSRNSPSGMLDSNCLDALRHPFLCGPRWRVAPSMDIFRWGLVSTAVRITEEYIYKLPRVCLQLALLSSLLSSRWIYRL